MTNIYIAPGHHSGARGAVNKTYGYSEWSLMVPFAMGLRDALDNQGFNTHFQKDARLHDKVNSANDFSAGIALDCHLNACNGTARGFECLYWESSLMGKMLAEHITDEFRYMSPRPIKPISMEERGSFFLRKTTGVAVILELAFIDNDQDVITFLSMINRYILHVSNGIEKFASPFER